MFKQLEGITKDKKKSLTTKSDFLIKIYKNLVIFMLELDLQYHIIRLIKIFNLNFFFLVVFQRVCFPISFSSQYVFIVPLP